MLKEPREAPTFTISPSEDSSRVATAWDTFSTCQRKEKKREKRVPIRIYKNKRQGV